MGADYYCDKFDLCLILLGRPWFLNRFGVVPELFNTL